LNGTKVKINQTKKNRGIDFNDAKEVFSDENRTISEDSRNDYGEKRWITIGMTRNKYENK